MKNENIEIGKNVIDLQIKALKKLKFSIESSFDKAVNIISKCQLKPLEDAPCPQIKL